MFLPYGLLTTGLQSLIYIGLKWFRLTDDDVSFCFLWRAFDQRVESKERTRRKNKALRKKNKGKKKKDCGVGVYLQKFSNSVVRTTSEFISALTNSTNNENETLREVYKEDEGPSILVVNGPVIDGTVVDGESIEFNDNQNVNLNCFDFIPLRYNYCTTNADACEQCAGSTEREKMSESECERIIGSTEKGEVAMTPRPINAAEIYLEDLAESHLWV